MKERLIHIDNAKAVGMMLIIASHIIPSEPFVKSPVYENWNSILNSFYVPLFFLLSGVFESTDVNDGKLCRRIVKLAKYICLCVMCASEIVIKGAQIVIDVNKDNMIVKVISDAKLAEGKILAYKNILAGILPDDGEASQSVALIYLRKILGEEVSFNIQNDENSFVLTIG